MMEILSNRRRCREREKNISNSKSKTRENRAETKQHTRKAGPLNKNQLPQDQLLIVGTPATT
jgi:hypothetical protein